jgi:phosphoglycerate dehydrogenase-like enzyme
VTEQLDVLVIAPNLARDLDWLEGVDPRVRVHDGSELARSLDGEAAPLLDQAEVILLGYPIPEGLAGRAPRLKWVHHTQAGVSNLHRTDLWRSQVVLTSSRGSVAATGIAEYVIAGAYHFARGLNEATRQKAEGTFSRRGYALRALTGATMGVVGLGGIGREVARLARANGMEVVATRRSVAEPSRDVEGVDLLLPPDGLGTLAGASDYIAVCAQWTPETEGLIDAAVLSAAQPHCVLINVARGELVDEDALVEALQQERLRGAVLDVYVGELDGRPPRRELVELPQVVLTPHISGGGDPHGRGPVQRLFVENLRRYLDGRPLVNLVDRERGY